jgi:hypothetical protein
VNKWSSSLPYFLLVLIPYLILLVYTVYTYSQSPDSLSHGLPKTVIWVPVAISVILPATYGVLAFRFREHLKPAHSLLLGFFMAVALLALTFVVHLFGSS